MTPQEREVINGIFERLKPAATQARDPDAEKHIAEMMRLQPYAPYVMAQSLYVQEQALASMNQQVQQLQAQVQQLEQQAQQQPAGGGFLSGLFGGGQSQPPRTPPAQANAWGNAPQGGMAMQPQAQPQGGPWAGAAAQQQPQSQGSGFLGTALMTAAGVAGGMVVGNMLMNAFSNRGSSGQGLFGSGSDSSGSGSDFQPFGNAGSPLSSAKDSAQDHAGYDDGNTYNASDDDGGDWDGGDDGYDV